MKIIPCRLRMGLTPLALILVYLCCGSEAFAACNISFTAADGANSGQVTKSGSGYKYTFSQTDYDNCDPGGTTDGSGSTLGIYPTADPNGNNYYDVSDAIASTSTAAASLSMSGNVIIVSSGGLLKPSGANSIDAFYYTPPANFSGTDTFTFYNYPDGNTKTPQTVTVTVVPTYTTVTYNGNGNTGGSVPIDSTAYSSGATVTVRGNINSLTRTGYTFNRWDTVPGGGGAHYVGGDTFSISSDTTLYAQWTANPPSAMTGPATSVTATGATLGGTVNDNGLATTVTFDYGLTTGYGTNVAATTNGTISADMGSTSVGLGLSGLTCNTPYHFRVKAVNAGGTTYGSDGSFTTTACVPGAPTIGTATAGNGQASVAFSAPGSNGGAAITGYTVTSSPGNFTGTGTTSPIIVTGLAIGTAYTFTVTATNSVGTGSASAASTSVTPKATQAITFANPGVQNFGTTPSLPATSDSGLTVAFTSSTTSVCTITSGGALTFLTTGTCTINADQAGNGTYLAATTVSQSFTVVAVVPGAPSIGTATAGVAQTTVTFSAPASNGGATITGYTVTSSPGSFTGTGTTSPITVTGLTNGTAYTFTVAATNSVGTGSASTASNSVTPKANQTITFANPGAQNFGTTPTLTATSDSSLTVTFSSSTTGVCTITSGGVLAFVTTGTCTIDADQAGNGTYFAATTVSRSFTVTAVVPGAPAITSVMGGTGQAMVTFTTPAFTGGAAITGYTVTSNPGNLTATALGSPILITGVTNGIAYTFTVTATNSAGAGPASAASASFTPKTGQTITFANPGTQNFGTTPTLTAATDATGLTPTFTSSTTGVCTVTTGGALTFLTTGTCTINADQAGNAAYVAATTVTRSFSVVAVVPGMPTMGSASAGDTRATVTFTAPAFTGGTAITGYTVTSSPAGGIDANAGSTGLSHVVTGLTNGISYTFTVTATNTIGTGSASAASNSVTPMTGQTIGAISFASASLVANGTTTADATASSGLTATFTSLTPTVCTVSGATVTGVAAGVCTIAADQAGDNAYSAAPRVTKNITVATTADAVHLTHGGTTTNHTTIQSAVDAAVDGDTIAIDAGIFVEQVTITKVITLQGAGIDQTIVRAPAGASLVQSGGTWKNLKDQDIYAVIGIKTNSTSLVTIKNLTVDGNDQGFLNTQYPSALPSTYEYTYDFQGIGAYNSTVTIDTVKVTGVRALATSFGATVPATYLPQDQPAGNNHNEGIFAESALGAAAHTVTVTNSTITKYQRTGLLAWGPTLTVDINNNTFQGYGKTLYSRGNAIQIASTDRSSYGGANGDRRGTTGTVTGNHILDIGIVIPAPGQDGSYLDLSYGSPSGVVLWQAGSGIQITGNTITGPGVPSWHSAATSNDGGYGNSGIDIYASVNAVTTNNTISGFDVGILDESTVAGSHLTASGNSFSNNTIDLWGGSGNDQLTLGSGAVTIAYAQTGNGSDTISGFGTGGSISVVGYTTGSVNDTIGTSPVYVTDVNNSSVINGYTDASPVVNFTGGTVTAGDGSSVAARSVQVAVSGGTTTLYINTDGVSGAQLQINLTGAYLPANFVLDGAYIRYAKVSQTIGAISPTPAALNVGGTATVNATATSGLAVAFTSATPSVCTVSGATVTAIAGGTCTVAADQAGNISYNAASQVTLDIAVSKVSQSIGAITFAPATLTMGRTATASATASSGLAVAFTSATPAVCTVSDTTVTPLAIGTCTVTANQSGNATYLAATAVSQNLTVAYSSAAPALTVSALSDGATTSEATQNVSGIVTDVNGIASLTINGTTVQVGATGSFSYPVQLVSGANTITVVATNNAGISTTSTRSVTLDTTGLQLTVTAPPDNKVIKQDYVVVTGTIAELLASAKTTAKTAAADVDPTLTVTYTVNGIAGTASLTDTTYSFTANLATGMNTIQIMATNGAGLKVQAKRTVSYQTGFSLAITDPAADLRTTQGSYLLTGTVADIVPLNAVTVTITVTADGQADQTYTPTVDGTTGAFQQPLTLTGAKVYQVAVTGVDQSNNSLTVQRNIIHVAAPSSFTVVDALLALKMTVGIMTPSSSQIERLDVAPLVNGVSVGDGKVDIEDVIVVLRKAVGLL